jgi:hypothetical protein
MRSASQVQLGRRIVSMHVNEIGYPKHLIARIQTGERASYKARDGKSNVTKYHKMTAETTYFSW